MGVQEAQRHLGQTIVVENRPGASGTLGAVAMREAKPDGYTLSQMPNAVFRMPAMQAKPAWDPLQDFTWIVRLVGYMGGVVVRPDAVLLGEIGEIDADARVRVVR